MNRKLPASIFVGAVLVTLTSVVCTDNTTTVAMPSTVNAEACEIVEPSATITNTPQSLQWRVVGYPLLYLDPIGGNKVRFRAPAVARETKFKVELTDTGSGDMGSSGTTEVIVSPAAKSANLAEGMVLDCAPFVYGVASGDPSSESVQLWTALDPADRSTSLQVRWEIATDPHMKDILQRGASSLDSTTGFTASFKVDNLKANTTYYYRFFAGAEQSTLGRTKTAPIGDAEKIKLAVASCSSIFSGYFNAYRRIAERDDIDLLIHLGDYIYDFVDEDEEIRIPTPYPQEPKGLEQWRERHRYYLADPDLRLARAKHPWFVIWDNHDTGNNPATDNDGTIQAFQEWVPMNITDPDHPEIAYRTLSYGNLLDVIMLDVTLHREVTTVAGTAIKSIMGQTQKTWLSHTLSQSKSTWRILGSQKPVATIPVPEIAQIFFGRDVFDTNTWDGYPAERSQIIGELQEMGLNNNIFLSGDSHISIAMDMVDNPTSPHSPYDPATSIDSVGVELLPSSISRGNLDERIQLDEDEFIAIAQAFMEAATHQVFVDFTRHGYGLVEITPDKLVAELWYSDILKPSDTEELGVSLTCLKDKNQWERE